MCGRYAINHLERVRALVEWLKIAEMPVPKTPDANNIPPTTEVPVLVKLDHQIQWQLKRWQLIPAWAKDLKKVKSTFNARSETVAEKPTFRTAYAKQQRCVIPMSSYYENQLQPSKAKFPFLVEPQQGVLLAAGLYEQTRIGEQIIHSCTMLTQEPPTSMRALHHRMPVWLAKEQIDEWLSPFPEAAETQQFFNQSMPEPLSLIPLQKYGDPTPLLGGQIEVVQ